MMLSPSEIAEKLSPDEYLKLCLKVENKYHQEFNVVDVQPRGQRSMCVVELKDNTRHVIHV